MTQQDFSTDVGELEDALCKRLCGEVSLHLRKDGKISISTPFRFPDGDDLLMIAEPTSTGGVRLSDFGNTLMHLSYSMNVDDLIKPGNQNDLFNKILIDHGVGFKHGVIYIETVVTEIGRAVFSLSQALSQIFDISTNTTYIATDHYGRHCLHLGHCPTPHQ